MDKKLLNVEVDIELDGATFHVGTLASSRGGVRFSYAQEWLASDRYFPLQPNIDGPGIFYPEEGRALHQCFSDTGPDRWGRSLLLRAVKRGLLDLNCVSEYTNTQELRYILMVSDKLRTGALRYRNAAGEYFTQTQEGVPQLIRLADLCGSARDLSIEQETESDLKNLLAPGSSLGGARPKAGIADKGKLYIAKFSKPNDGWNVPLWEYVNLRMAKDAGLRVPEFRLEKFVANGVKTTALLAARFDRANTDDTQLRIPFLSSLSMLGAGEMERRGYMDIAEAIERYSDDSTSDLRELWRRMVFNILITNTDDHLRNHGFLRTASGWRLSPLYDLESSPESEISAREWCTGIEDGQDRYNTIEKAIKAAPLFRLSNEQIAETLDSMRRVVGRFDKYAKNAGAANKEIEFMSSAYRNRDMEYLQSH